jgi:CHU_C Type IX secretion signal domain/SprB repeat
MPSINKLHTSTLLLVLLVWVNMARSQCTNTINVYPYIENFETSNGNWFVAGNSQNADWVWGSPSKPVIASAASGNNCWVVGGLTASSYNNGEKSFLQSPCFDFSTLAHPYITIKTFWETEKKYDGANLQYSIDGGNTWDLVGSYTDYVNCPSSNWFNTQNINTLGGAGWSGNIQTSSPCAGGTGNGIGDWALSKSAMDNLAGKPYVQFRFAFAAGTQCNDFDGFAIDDITITEAPTNTADFNYTCTVNNTVSFSLVTGLCPSGVVWNFGDITSTNNTSTSFSPTHIFTTSGSFSVSATVSFTGNPSITIPPKTITILDVSTTITDTIKCFGNKTGAITAVANGGNGIYNYSWNTNPIQNTEIINNLAANNYTVTASAAGMCSSTKTVVLKEPTNIKANFKITKSKCGNSNGAILTTITGGTPQYQFSWSSGKFTDSLTNILANTYNLQVTDANNCIANFNNIIVGDTTIKVLFSLGNDTTICPGNKLVLQPTGFANIKWQNGLTSATFTIIKTGQYWANVTDSNGCTATDTINVLVDCSDVFFASAFTPNGKNPTFGALGNINAIKNFTFLVYDRWGNIVFETKNATKKWNGGNYDSGNFVWFANYILNGISQFKKGIVTLLRGL